MKKFLGLWLLSTAFFTVVVYILIFILVFGAAFVAWSVEPIQAGMNQMDWTAFRVTLCIATSIGFFFALSEFDN